MADRLKENVSAEERATVIAAMVAFVRDRGLAPDLQPGAVEAVLRAAVAADRGAKPQLLPEHGAILDQIDRLARVDSRNTIRVLQLRYNLCASIVGLSPSPDLFRPASSGDSPSPWFG